jgi:DNA-binding MarR family transcriptional regulator
MEEVEVQALQANLRAVQRMLRASVPPVDGVSRSAVRVLGVVARSGSVQPGEIARELGMTSSNVAATLRELERQRYIERGRVATDARRAVVSLTKRGSDAVAAHRLLRAIDLRAKIEATLTATEQEQVAAAIRLLGKVAGAYAAEERS